MSESTEPRFWTIESDPADDESNRIASVENVVGFPIVGLVDENAGGVIAYVSRPFAGLILSALESRYGADEDV